MRCGYFDCFSGAAGDMILATLLDAGVKLNTFQDVVTRLKLPDVDVTAEKVQRGGIAASRVAVEIGPAARDRHRHLPEILDRIAAAGFSARVTENARRVFTRLAEAEAAVHGIAIDKVHFHEVGAADAIVDIVGACAGVAELGLERIICSPIPTGTGTVTCEHGILPVPAPATAELLKGIPLAECAEPSELTTPTGAAILTTLADGFGPLPAIRIESIGYGAGTRENRARPNLLRLIVGQAGESDAVGSAQDTVAVLETQVDDATGQALAHTSERLLNAGALDAFIVPIIMKKGRPGQLLTVLCRPADVADMEAIIFGETTTFGIRRHECPRSKLIREQVTVKTRFGAIRVQLGRRGDAVLKAWPEYDDCAAAACANDVALRDVQDAALRASAER